MQSITFRIGDREIGKRLDIILARRLDNLTRSYIQNLISSKYVSINDRIVMKSSYKAKRDDTVTITIPPPKKIEIREENIPLEILYEDKSIAIIEKPKGMIVHPAPGNYSGTLANALLYHFSELSSVGGILRPGIVHRLDKDTSGLLLVAKTNTAHKRLAKDFKNRKIRRIYWAIVERNIRKDEGTINTPIARHPIDRKRMAVVNSKSSRNAITHFKVLKRFKGYTLVELELETGRTHQLRVHMAHIGNPIVGDTIYGSKRQRFSIQGQVLHAKRLAFIHPVTREYMEFDGNLPSYFVELISNINE